MPLLLALLGATLTVGAIGWYFAIIHRETVPESVSAFAGTIMAGIALGGIALDLDPGLPTGVLFGLSAALGGFILFLLTQRHVPDGELVVDVGDPLPALVATDHTGAPFDLASLKQRRVMLKFFRGSW